MPSQQTEGAQDLTTLVRTILKEFAPSIVSGFFQLSEEIILVAPPELRQEFYAYENWSVCVFAVPITDQTLWVWHKLGNTRLLFANFVLMKGALAIKSTLEKRGILAVDVVERFGERVSMSELGLRAGLGTRGLNNLLLHPVYGSWIQIHSLFVNTYLSSTALLESSVCTKCGNCIVACPARALTARDFRRERCSELVASPWNPKSKAIALTHDAYVECAECISSCPIGKRPEGIFAWRR